MFHNAKNVGNILIYQSEGRNGNMKLPVRGDGRGLGYDDEVVVVVVVVVLVVVVVVVVVVVAVAPRVLYMLNIYFKVWRSRF